MSAVIGLIVYWLCTGPSKGASHDHRPRPVCPAPPLRKANDHARSPKSFIGLALRAQEEERFRLSRELHDETVQELVVAKAALENVPEGQGQHARLELVDAALQRCIDGIQRFCRALRPSVLDDLGLVPALE